MKHIFTISLCFLALSLSAQETITYPYNPDGDADGLVAVPDIQDLLAVYGSPFTPAEIMVGDTALSEWIQILYQALQDQQAVIESMQGAGGCDLKFPDGFDGIPVYIDLLSSSYTVPTGKNLYISSTYRLGGSTTILEVNGLRHSTITSANFQAISAESPLIIKAGDMLSGNDLESGASHINAFGFLIDDIIDPVYIDLLSSSYTVPTGKNLYISSTYRLGGSTTILEVNGLRHSTITSANFQAISAESPLIIKAGDMLSGNDLESGASHINAFGYLADEDYFADCGGGGSSGGGSVSSLDSLTIASMINNAILQQIGHGDNYQGGIVAYIFQPGDAAYVPGEVHGYLAYYDGTTIGWGCEGVATAIGVNNTSVGQGPVNTQQLVNTCTESDFAAKWCNDLVIGGNSDWFLPNVSELMLFQPAALYTICGGCSITAWTSQEAVVGLYGCSGNSNSCCYPVDFANTFFVTGSGNELGSHNRKMPGGINACGGWGGSHVIAYRQF